MKNCGLLFITNPPLSVYASPPLQNNIKTRHTSTKAARRLTRALCHPGYTFQPQTMVYTVVTVTPSSDPQRSSLHINNIEGRTAINYIIALDKYQALLWDTQWVCLGSCSSKHRDRKKLHVCTALDISNIRPLKVNAQFL
jgi:hypothetical protein